VKGLLLVFGVLVTLPAAVAGALPVGPVGVSPGSTAQILTIDQGCPTFRWAPVVGARGYELAVHAFDEEIVPAALQAEVPSLQEKTSGSASSWTPSPDRCLRPGSYVWSVRAQLDQGVTDWSELLKFRVAPSMPTPGHEAAAPAQESGGAPSGGAAQVFEKITVTAQKRAENIRDVPISITALTGDQIEDAGVKSSLELGTVVPGLKMDRVGASTIPAIRGVSSYLTTVGTDANVAMYVDDIYVSSMQAATLDLSDIRRIEVLKGPQGSLFGRNATGGAIRIFTKDPRMTSFGGDFSLGYGSFDDTVLKGYLSGPLVPGKLAASLTGYRETADTYYHNLNPDVPLQRIDNYSLRAKILFTPADDTRFVLSAYTGQHRDPSAILYFPFDGITIAKTVPGAIVPSEPYDVATSVPIFEKVSSDGVNFHLSRNTSGGDLSLLGAWSLTKADGPVPLIAAAYPAPFTGYQGDVNDRSEAWSGDLNFSSRKFDKFSFIAGASYYEKFDKWDPLEAVQSIPGSEFAISIFAAQSTKAYALYGEGTYQVTGRLSVIAGFRYSNERRGATGSTVSGLQPTGEYYDWGSRTFDRVTPRVSVRYDVAPTTDVYFTYSTGFKSGNFIATSIPFGVTPAECEAANAATPGSCVFPPVLEPEEIDSYEVGIKSAPQSWLEFDAALFAYELTHIQIQSYTSICVQEPCPPNPLVQLSEYTNAAAGRMYGAEANVDARVTNELQLHAGISLLDAKFSSYENASWPVPAPGGVGMVQVPATSADGKRLPRAPRATLDLSGTYTKYVTLGVFSFTATGYGSDKFYYDVGNVFSQPSYATLGLRASFTPATLPHLTATAWGNNVTDTRVIQGTILGDSGANLSYAAPATYGVTLGCAF
jgi:iron complex outermembrane recepter protein